LDDIARLLAKRLGEDKISTDPLIIELYTREASGLEGDGVVAVVFPETPEDVRDVVRLAVEHRVPVYPQGSATSLSGNAVPAGGIVVSFERMNRILEVDIVDGVAVVEPGVRIDDLNLELSRHGYMFPVDPASSAVATVGGAINNGAGGMRGAKYGTMRDWVLGVDVVIADDEASLVRAGCRTVKCRQGYDITRLIVGSEGTLGLVTRAILRIIPEPEQVVYALAFYPRLEDLAATVVEVRKSRLHPLLMEFMDERSVALAARAAGVRLEAEGHMLLVGVDVNREAAERVLNQLVDTMRAHGATHIQTAMTTQEAWDKGLFTIRKNLFASQVLAARETLGPGVRPMVLLEDIVVPPSRIVEAVRRLRELEEKYGLTMTLGGHIGDGNLHPAVGYDPSDPDMARRVEEWYREVMRLALELGGSVSAEHGIGLLKKEGLRMEAEARGSPRLLELMKEIKRVFDPHGILNPGKVV